MNGKGSLWFGLRHKNHVLINKRDLLCSRSGHQASFWADLQIEDGIKAYKAIKPRIVTVSSAAVERNAVIGDNADARKKDIPIVQLNPGGILNYKYMGENAVRSSGLPYTVVRPVGRVSIPFIIFK